MLLIFLSEKNIEILIIDSDKSFSREVFNFFMPYITWTGARTSVASVTDVKFKIFFDI